ncbi:hypothetical protein Bbelb_407070 [Branchiostoma belcheri]|nr:hypothetical protein Bbelb_407070 [Branchiostoma belcheri]
MRGGKAPEVEPNLVKLDADPAEWKAIRENFLFASRIRKKFHRNTKSPLKRDVTMENLQTFSWDDTVTWTEELAPMSVGMLKAVGKSVGMSVGMLKALLPKVYQRERNEEDDEKEEGVEG